LLDWFNEKEIKLFLKTKNGKEEKENECFLGYVLIIG
jgi:hypothetical protein